MSLGKAARSACFEWTVGVTGIATGLYISLPTLHLNLDLLLFLIALALMLEGISIPLGKLTTTLLLGLPMGVMVIYGYPTAVLIVIIAQLGTPFLVGLRPRLATICFNAGQNAFSVLGMIGVYRLVWSQTLAPTINWVIVFGVCLGGCAFLVLNHGFIHALNALRGQYERTDIRDAMWSDGISVIMVLPFSFLMIALGPYHPLLAPLAMAPISILSQTLRMYRRSMLLQRIYATSSQLADEFDTDLICREIATSARNISAADGVVIYFVSPDHRELLPVIVEPVTDELLSALTPVHSENGGIVWDVLHKNQWEYIPLVQKDPRKSGPCIESVAQSMAVFPLHTRGDLQGAVVCYSFRPYAFNERIQYVSALAMQVSILLANASLYQQLQEQSWRDGATGLYNYRYFYEVLSHRIGSAAEHGRHVSVAILDIDFFKKVNDTYGHLAGDAVVKSIGQLLVVQAGQGAIVARYGGEEFGIILPMHGTAAYRLMEQIRQAISHHVVEFGDYRLMGITVSIGIAAYPTEGVNDRDILLKADSAMYWGAKQQGRNRTAIYSPDMDTQLFVDSLTGLYTHHFVNMRIREEFAHGVRRFGVICLDLEGLGRIHTQFSFRAGDRVLQETSVVIKECLRHSELVCRFGGDQFLAVFPNIPTTELEVIAERLDRAISTHGFTCSDNVVTHIRPRFTTACFDDLESEVDLFARTTSLFGQLNDSSDRSWLNTIPAVE